MNSTDTRPRRPRPDHVAAELEPYVDGRLEAADSQSIDAHVLNCDNCFALLVALHLRRDSDSAA